MKLPGMVLREVFRALAFAPTGYAGSVTPARFVGGTGSGAPVSGKYVARDFVISGSGQVWVCTASGSPGTWTRAATKAEVDDLDARLDDLESRMTTVEGVAAHSHPYSTTGHTH